MSTRQRYVRALLGFAVAVVLFYGLMAASELRDFRPTEESSTPLQRVAFSTIILGGTLVICSGTPFCLGLAAFSFGRRRLPVPFVLGTIAGLLVAVLAGFGLVGHYGRSVPIPFPVAAAIPGLLAAVAILPVAFLLAPTTPSSRPGT